MPLPQGSGIFYKNFVMAQSKPKKWYLIGEGQHGARQSGRERRHSTDDNRYLGNNITVENGEINFSCCRGFLDKFDNSTTARYMWT